MLLTQYKNSAMLATRLTQIMSMVSVVTGFVWALTDLLLVTVLVDSPVTPISVLLMLYGFIGSLLTEGIARWIARSDSSSEKKHAGGV